MVIFSQCIDCKHLIGKMDDENFNCKAFPNAIPKDIFWNKIYHTKPIDGDNGILYEDEHSNQTK